MPCFRPLQGYRARDSNPSGKRGIVFNVSAGYRDLPVEVPCGQCIGCRLERSRQWAVRCVHEASLHEENMFLTLTYADEELPTDGSLRLRDFQLFMKRLRKFAGRKLRFFHCGEYGEQLRRPHYHALIFGYEMPDKAFWKKQGDARLYTSLAVEKLWGHGFCSIGDVSFESAAYVARYVVKKVTGELADDHYRSVDSETGEIGQVKPEYITMSRRPGIGAGWLEKYSDEVYPNDYVVINGRKVSPVRFYDRRFEAENPELFKSVRYARIARAGKAWANNTPERLAVRETCAKARTSLLKRNVE